MTCQSYRKLYNWAGLGSRPPDVNPTSIRRTFRDDRCCSSIWKLTDIQDYADHGSAQVIRDVVEGGECYKRGVLTALKAKTSCNV